MQQNQRQSFEFHVFFFQTCYITHNASRLLTVLCVMLVAANFFNHVKIQTHIDILQSRYFDLGKSQV